MPALACHVTGRLPDSTRRLLGLEPEQRASARCGIPVLVLTGTGAQSILGRSTETAAGTW
jgi:hypothetical protein